MRSVSGKRLLIAAGDPATLSTGSTCIVPRTQYNMNEPMAVNTLKVMVHDDDEPDTPEPVSEEDRRRFHEGQAWFAQRGGNGIPMEDVLSEFGMNPEDFPINK